MKKEIGKKRGKKGLRGTSGIEKINICMMLKEAG